MVDASLSSQIDADVAGNKVMVYSKSYCPYCVSTKDLLNQKGITFKVIELDQVANGNAIQQALLSKTGQRTVPNIFINGSHLGGNSDLQAAASNGSLDTKLNG